MKYFVYRLVAGTNQTFREIAQTAYREDAEAVLNNWNQGYIASGGEIIVKKNVNI